MTRHGTRHAPTKQPSVSCAEAAGRLVERTGWLNGGPRPGGPGRRPWPRCRHAGEPWGIQTDSKEVVLSAAVPDAVAAATALGLEGGRQVLMPASPHALTLRGLPLPIVKAIRDPPGGRVVTARREHAAARIMRLEHELAGGRRAVQEEASRPPGLVVPSFDAQDGARNVVSGDGRHLALAAIGLAGEVDAVVIDAGHPIVDHERHLDPA